jgi:Prenyltransferase and squalene oxidase repeat
MTRRARRARRASAPRRAPGLTAAVLGLVLVLAGVATAAPAEVRLRVEGRTATLFEGFVASEARPLDGGDGTGAHACGASAPAPLTALADAGVAWGGRWNPDFQDFFVDRVGPDRSDDTTASYWAVLADWRYVAGGCRGPLRPGTEVLWAYGVAVKPLLLKLAGPARAEVGETVTVTVRDGRIRPSTGADGGPVAGATVGGAATDAEGRALLRYDTPGLRLLKAEHPDGIRSNALALCVGDAACQGSVPPPGATPGPDPRRPGIAKIRVGERFARGAGPRILRGSAGGAAVDVTLARRTASGCQEWNAARRRLVERPCGAPAERFTAPVRGGAWRYELARGLPPGRYELTVWASGAAPSPARRAVPPAGSAARSPARGPRGAATAATLSARVPFTIAARPRSRPSAVRAGVRFLLRAQARAGGFGAAPGRRPSALMTGWAALALARVAPANPALRSARRLLRTPPFRPRSLADLERSILALQGSPNAADRRAAARRRRALAVRQRANGSFAGDPNLTAFGILALDHEKRYAPHRRRAGRWLAARQLADGGFPLSARTRAGDVDTTGAALWALGPSLEPTAIRRARAFLRAAQSHDGGFGMQAGQEANSQTTALAVAGMRAAGIAPARMRTEDGITPLDYLRARMGPGGSVAYDGSSERTPVWVTAQALLALADQQR